MKLLDYPEDISKGLFVVPILPIAFILPYAVNPNKEALRLKIVENMLNFNYPFSHSVGDSACPQVNSKISSCSLKYRMDLNHNYVAP